MLGRRRGVLIGQVNHTTLTTHDRRSSEWRDGHERDQKSRDLSDRHTTAVRTALLCPSDRSCGDMISERHTTAVATALLSPSDRSSVIGTLGSITGPVGDVVSHCRHATRESRVGGASLLFLMTQTARVRLPHVGMASVEIEFVQGDIRAAGARSVAQS